MLATSHGQHGIGGSAVDQEGYRPRFRRRSAHDALDVHDAHAMIVERGEGVLTGRAPAVTVALLDTRGRCSMRLRLVPMLGVVLTLALSIPAVTAQQPPLFETKKIA